MVVLAIDYGEKRVGLAIAGGESARPHRLKVVANTPNLIADLGEVIERQEVGEIVVGLPRNLDGDDTAQTGKARAFSQHLQQQYPDIKIILQDEADTSNIARERLGREGLVGDELKRWLDAEAAVIILEDYLAEH